MEPEKEELRARYDAAADAYAVHWAPALATLSERFVDGLELPTQGRILDVGAGTGRLSAYVRARTAATVISVDQSPRMLRLAGPQGRTAVMDAERLALADASFDAVLAMFMLFHLPHPDAGLREMRRVARPGAVLALTTWGAEDPDPAMLPIWNEILARHGAIAPGSLYARDELMDTTDKCVGLLTAAGFDVVSCTGERMAHPWTVEHYLGYRTQVGYGRVRWASLEPPAQERALAEARERFSAMSQEECTERDEVIYTVARAAD